jgi:hypothetical protein
MFDSLFKNSKDSENNTENSEELPKIESISQQTPEEKKVVEWVNKKVEESRMSSSRISHEGVWMTNIAYVLGFDGVFYDTTTRQFRSAAKGNTSLRRNRVHVNKILPSIQNRLARLCKNPPKYDVRPNSNEVEDKEASRLSLQVLNNIFDKQQVNQKRMTLYMWMQECGHAYAKVCWDPDLGEEIEDPDTGDVMYEGDVRIDVVPALEVFPDALAKTLDECQWIAHAKLRKLDYFKSHYPDRGHLVKEEGARLLSLQYEMRINSLNVQGQGQTGAQTIAKSSAIEIIYYEKKSTKHPRGRQIAISNGVLLEDKELAIGEIPFSKFDDVLVGGKYYSESVVTHARPLQDQLNRIIALRAAWTNKMLTGKWKAPKGSGLQQESINDQSGEVWEYNPLPGGQVPEAVQVPTIPQYAYEEEDRLDKMFDDTFGINEISKGQLPAAGIPAIGMQFLMEQDDTRIGVITENNEYSWARVGKHVLKFVAKFYKTPRLLKTAGKGLEYTVKSFLGSEVEGHDDVIVIRGSTLPGSKVLRRQEILNLRSQGLLGNPQDPETTEKVLGMLEYSDVQMNEVWQELAVDEAQVAKDIKLIEQEIPPQIQQWDNHKLHCQKKNLYRKSEKWHALSQTSQQILLADIEARIQLLVMSANPQLAAQLNEVKLNQQQLQQAARGAATTAGAQAGGLNQGINNPNIPGSGGPPPVPGGPPPSSMGVAPPPPGLGGP